MRTGHSHFVFTRYNVLINLVMCLLPAESWISLGPCSIGGDLSSRGYGVDGLHPKRRSVRLGHPHTLSVQDEQAILALAVGPIRRVGLGTRIERLSLLERHSAQRAELLTERTRRKLRRRLASSVISPAPSPKQDGQSNVCSPTEAASSRLTSIWPARTLKSHIHAQSHGGLEPMASSKDCKAPSSMNTGGSPSEGPASLHKDSLKLHSNASSASTTTNDHTSNTLRDLLGRSKEDLKCQHHYDTGQPSLSPSRL